MDKIKNLLLPLALVFAAIAVFECGARYAVVYSISSELIFSNSLMACSHS